jgi:hypothetical protein
MLKNQTDFIFLLSKSKRDTKPLDIEHINKEYSYKIWKRHVQTISIKYMYTETIKDISIRYNYTRNNRRLQMSMNDKDSYGGREMNIIVKLTNITIWPNLIYKIYNLIKFANS